MARGPERPAARSRATSAEMDFSPAKWATASTIAPRPTSFSGCIRGRRCTIRRLVTTTPTSMSILGHGRSSASMEICGSEKMANQVATGIILTARMMPTATHHLGKAHSSRLELRGYAVECRGAGRMSKYGALPLRQPPHELTCILGINLKPWPVSVHEYGGVKLVCGWARRCVTKSDRPEDVRAPSSTVSYQTYVGPSYIINTQATVSKLID